METPEFGSIEFVTTPTYFFLCMKGNATLPVVYIWQFPLPSLVLLIAEELSFWEVQNDKSHA